MNPIRQELRLNRRWLIAACLSFSSCVGSIFDTLRVVETGQLATTGARIEAEDGSFVIESGKSFTSPFSCHTPGVHNLPKGLADRYGESLAAGARKVRVFVPGREAPLFGVLALERIPGNSIGPGAESYLISIPDEYVAAAERGQVSVVFESVDVLVHNLFRDTNRPYGWSWALWLSVRPLR